MTETHVPATEQLVVEVFVRNLEQSIAFYRQLGFQPLGGPQENFAAFAWEGHKFFLEEVDGLPPVPEHPVCNMRIMVPDVDWYWDLAQSMGAKVLKPIADRYYGLRDFTIIDPDGMGIRFGTRLD